MKKITTCWMIGITKSVGLLFISPPTHELKNIPIAYLNYEESGLGMGPASILASYQEDLTRTNLFPDRQSRRSPIFLMITLPVLCTKFLSHETWRFQEVSNITRNTRFCWIRFTEQMTDASLLHCHEFYTHSLQDIGQQCHDICGLNVWNKTNVLFCLPATLQSWHDWLVC